MASTKKHTKNTDINKYFADFETTSIKYYNKHGCTKVGLWGIMRGSKLEKNEQFKWGDNIDTFLDHVFTLKDKSIIFFHNLSWDGFFLMCNIARGIKEGFVKDYNVLMDASNTIFALSLTNEEKTINFQCTNLLFGYLSVAKIGAMLDRPKREINYDREEYTISEDDITYLHEDIAIVRDFMNIDKKSPISRTNGRKIRLTAGSASVAYFRKQIKGLDHFLGRNKLTVQEGDSINYYATFGGLSVFKEKFRNIEHGECVYLDRNSMYPAIQTERLPFGRPLDEAPNDSFVCLRYYKINYILKKDQDMPNHFHTKTAETRYRLRTYFEEYFGKPFIIAYWDQEGEELNKTYTIGYELIKTCYFRTTRVMKKPTEDLYFYKENAPNQVTREIVKRTLVSWGGKQGQDRKRKVPIYNLDTMERTLKDEEELDENKLSPIYIASYILAMARVNLLQTIRPNAKRWLYSDTDSCVFLGKEIPTNIPIDEKKLGYGKVERQLSRFKYLRSKCYIYETTNGLIRSVSAGINNPTTDFENFTDGLTITKDDAKKLARKIVPGGYILTFIDGTINSPEKIFMNFEKIISADKNLVL